MEDYYFDCEGPFSLESYMFAAALDFNRATDRHKAVKELREAGYIQVLRTIESGKPRRRVWITDDGKHKDYSLHNRTRKRISVRKTTNDELMNKIRYWEDFYKTNNNRSIDTVALISALGLPHNPATIKKIEKLYTAATAGQRD